jgi:hypothetical protein
MKKSLPKLVLHKETLRALSGTDLTRVIAGVDTEVAHVPQSKDKLCSPAAAVAPRA